MNRQESDGKGDKKRDIKSDMMKRKEIPRERMKPSKTAGFNVDFNVDFKFVSFVILRFIRQER